MNFPQYLRNKKQAIENYLEDSNHPVASYRLFKPRKYAYFNTHPQNTYSKIIRKELQITNDQLRSSDSYHATCGKAGLYHNRNEDWYDTDHIDCVEDGFCMKHTRTHGNGSYKYHYHCKHGMCTHSYFEPHVRHGEKKWFSNKFVCFDCRKCITQRIKKRHRCLKEWPKCSHCQTHMTSVSVAFQPPSKHDIKHWQKLDKEWYSDSRITYDEYAKLYQTI